MRNTRRSKADMTMLTHRCPYADCGNVWKSLMDHPSRCKKCKRPMKATSDSSPPPVTPVVADATEGDTTECEQLKRKMQQQKSEWSKAHVNALRRYENDERTLVYWLLQAYRTLIRESWDDGMTRNEATDALCSVLANWGYDPSSDDAALLLNRKPPSYGPSGSADSESFLAAAITNALTEASKRVIDSAVCGCGASEHGREDSHRNWCRVEAAKEFARIVMEGGK